MSIFIKYPVDPELFSIDGKISKGAYPPLDLSKEFRNHKRSCTGVVITFTGFNYTGVKSPAEFHPYRRAKIFRTPPGTVSS
jgi:hypothetical protein